MQTAKSLAAATPTTRNRYVDLLRLLAIGVVVFGHWLIAIVTIDSAGAVKGTNLLGEAAWTGYLSWVFQIMPIFFIVGAYANLGSWTSALSRGDGYVYWLRLRVARLMRPTAVFIATWIAIVAALEFSPIDVSRISVGAQVVTIPLWFLSVYLMAVAAAPAMAWLHSRFDVWVVVAAVIGAALIDRVARFGDLSALGYANYAFVWLGIHQLGFFWREGRVTKTVAAALAVIGGFGVVALTQIGSYPVAMVGVENANTQQPSLALFALGVMQFGVMMLLEPAANRFLRRERVWTAVIAGNGSIMSLYLWHQTALVVGAVALVATGVWPQLIPLTGAWWLLQLAWMAALAVIVVPFAALFTRFERGIPEQSRAGRSLWIVVLGVASLVVGMAMMTKGGFHQPGQPLGLPWPAAGALVGGLALVDAKVFGKIAG